MVDEDPTDNGFRHPLYRDVPESVAFKKLRKRLVRLTREAIDTFSMVPPSPSGPGARHRASTSVKRPRWLVCLSGGKHSYTLLATLLDLQWQGALPVDLLACNVDQGQPGFPKHVLPEFLTGLGVPHRIEYADTYSIVTEKVPETSTYCALCSRLRRGILYRIAREEGCDAVVLGHHRDDLLETFFMNLFHGGRLATIPPKLVNEEGDVMVLRPLALCAEQDIARFAELMRFPIIPCNLCGTQDGLQRVAVKAMLDEWDLKARGRRQVMFRFLMNTRPSHLADPGLFDFAGLWPRPVAAPECGRG